MKFDPSFSKICFNMIISRMILHLISLVVYGWLLLYQIGEIGSMITIKFQV